MSENYHLQQLAEHLERTVDAIKVRLKSFFNERLSVMEAEFDPKKVETSMVHIEENLVRYLDSFESTMKSLNEAHDKEQEALQELMDANIARMQLMSRTVLTEFEKTDRAKHWKSRRPLYQDSCHSIKIGLYMTIPDGGNKHNIWCNRRAGLPIWMN